MSTQPYTDTLGFVLAQADASRTEKFYLPGAAISASEEQSVLVVPSQGVNYYRVRKVSITFDAAISHAATNGATIQLAYRNGAGGSQHTFGTTYSTLTTDAVAFTPIILNGTTGNANLDLALLPGYVVTLVVTKNGTGVTLPGMNVTIEGVTVPVIN